LQRSQFQLWKADAPGRVLHLHCRGRARRRERNCIIIITDTGPACESVASSRPATRRPSTAVPLLSPTIALRRFLVRIDMFSVLWHNFFPPVQLPHERHAFRVQCCIKVELLPRVAKRFLMTKKTVVVDYESSDALVSRQALL